MTTSTMTTSTLTFGTRGSLLARQQTQTVADSLLTVWQDLNLETIIFTTKGDRELQKSLPEIGGKGLFTAELETALYNGQIDLAVHSLKDLPTENPTGLTIGAVLPRANPSDVLISRSGQRLDDLPAGATIGTSSLRRAAQLLAYRPDFQIQSIRGNIDTRIAKGLAEDGPYDGIILAAAGLERLELTKHITETLSFELMLPAPAQGAVAVQCRVDDRTALVKLAQIDHDPTRQAVIAERAFLAALNGGCQVPVAAYAEVNEAQQLSLQGLVTSLDGQHVIRVSAAGSAVNAFQLGQALAQQAIEQGAQAILETIQLAATP